MALPFYHDTITILFLNGVCCVSNVKYDILLYTQLNGIDTKRTLLELRCRVSLYKAPVSQFFTFMNLGHLVGLPFCTVLVGETLPWDSGCGGTNITSYY